MVPEQKQRNTEKVFSKDNTNYAPVLGRALVPHRVKCALYRCRPYDRVFRTRICTTRKLYTERCNLTEETGLFLRSRTALSNVVREISFFPGALAHHQKPNE